jgi:hypothetical protein
MPAGVRSANRDITSRTHTGRMDSDSRGRGERHRDALALLTGESASDMERGAVMLGLFAHAVVYLLLTGAQVAWCAVTAVRVWRRRDAGWPAALRGGVHRPTLAGLGTATVAYAVLRKLGLAVISRRAREHAARSADAGS